MTHTQTTYINRIVLRAGKKGTRSAEVGALVRKISYRAQTTKTIFIQNACPLNDVLLNVCSVVDNAAYGKVWFRHAGLPKVTPVPASQ